MRNGFDAHRVCGGESGLLQFKHKPGRAVFSLCAVFPIAMEITECLCFRSLKRSLIIHGEGCLGLGSRLQHVNMAARAQGTALGFKGKSATYCVIILDTAASVCLLEFPRFSFAYFVLASGRCERIQN